MRKTQPVLLRSLCALLTMLSCTSCITIIGLTDDYNKLTDEQKLLIHEFENEASLRNGNVYLINADELKQELSKHEKSMVYCFTNGCSSEYCEPMNNYIDYATQNGYKLFLVMNGFGNISSTLNQSAATPYYAIDSEFYKTKFRSKYFRMFRNELLNRDRNYKESQYEGSIYLFEGSKWVETRRSLSKK